MPKSSFQDIKNAVVPHFGEHKFTDSFVRTAMSMRGNESVEKMTGFVSGTYHVSPTDSGVAAIVEVIHA